jgi:glucosamine 6-phosphate synthetase-like amidotransferase/phosphosugar isomerase protein
MIKGDLLKIPKKLLHKFQANEIDEIVITGMGTCHTAAVAIAAIMTNHPAIKESKIRIKAYLASELSAFHIRENMNHTVLIAIAQSGTTMDTNVAVKMARKQGAHTLAILNKREGDISYLVDTTLYLGNGRDIEIAVPSTKTYVCHILVGYILTCFLGQEINRGTSDDYLALKKLIDLPQQLSAIIENFNSSQLTPSLDKFLQIPQWYVVYDSPDSYIAGIEARIKLSECCYQSVPLLSVEEFIDAGVNNAVVIFLAGSSRSKVQDFLDKANKCNNYIVLVGDNQVISKAQLPKDSITKIQYASSSRDLAILPMIINCQLLAYNIALKLDSRQHFFLNLADDIHSQKDCMDRLQEILLIEKNDLRFSGYQEEKLDSLRNNISQFLMYSNNESLDLVKEDLWYLARYSIRPIDTIKHQAKTITVGTQRQKTISENKSSTVFSDIQNELPFSSHSFNKQRSNKLGKAPNSTVCLKGKKVDFKLLKFMVNFLNSSRLNFDNLPNFEYHIEGEVGHTDDIIFLISQKNKGNTDTKEINVEEKFFLLNNPETQRLLSKLESNSCKINNGVILSLFDGLGACISIMRFLLKSADNDNLNHYIGMLVEQITLVFHHSESSKHKIHVNEISQMFKNAKNIKFIGSGENYDAAQYLAALSIKKFNKPFSFDVLENHKHIDMSAEALIINLISNILDESYQNDAYSEIEKENAHNNVPIIITNSFDNRFDDMSIEVFKIPCVAKEIALLTYMIHFKKLLF